MTETTAALSSGAVRPQSMPSASLQQDKDAEGDDRAVASADFETFLSLLTAQMRNQDPLKPMESTEFVAQLASFSAVEQQIQANDRLEAILDALSGGQGAGLAEWIGLEAETSATLRHGGGSLELSVDPPVGADRAVLAVTTPDGRLIGNVPMGRPDERFAWDGRVDGLPLPPGDYDFAVRWFEGETVVSEAPARRTVRLADLRLGEDGPRFGVVGGGEIGPDDVSALRRPGDA